VRVVVVEDRERDDLVSLIAVVAVAVARDPAVQRPIAVRALVRVRRRVRGATYALTALSMSPQYVMSFRYLNGT